MLPRSRHGWREALLRMPWVGAASVRDQPVDEAVREGRQKAVWVPDNPPPHAQRFASVQERRHADPPPLERDGGRHDGDTPAGLGH